MLVSIVVPEKLPGQKRCDEEAEEEEEEEKEEHEFLCVLTSFYSNPDRTISNFFDVYVFILSTTAH